MNDFKCNTCKNLFPIEDILRNNIYHNNTNVLKRTEYICHNCYNSRQQEIKYKNKLINYIRTLFNIPMVSSYMQKQIKEMRECNLHLNNKQIMYVIFYTYKVQKLLDPKFNYTLALAQGKITEALEHANKKGIDLLSFDEDYFKPEKQKMQDETLDLTNEIKRKNNEKELSQKNKEQYKKELEIRNKKFQEEFLNAPIKKIEERDVENFLIDHLELVEEGLSFIDHQVEVTNGVIDIIARDKTDTLCIIEVKNKKDAKDLVFQVNYYPTCFNEKLRMIVIAPEYSDRILQVLKKVPNIELYCFNAFLGTKGHPINKLDIRKIS